MKNKNSKSGKYNFSLTTVNDSHSGIILSYIINEYQTIERISRIRYGLYELVTMGFNDGIDFYDYIVLLESIGVQQLIEDKTTLELLN